MNRPIRFLNKPVQRLRAWWREEYGSFMLESSIVFPLVFISVLMLMLMSLLVYQRVVLYYSASAAAERAAFLWDNSHRDAVSGIRPAGMYDGLYWRLHDDGMLKGIFNLGGGDEGEFRMPLPAASSAEGSGNELRHKKLIRSGGRIMPSLSGEMAYRNTAILRTVTTSLESRARIGPLQRLLGRSGGKASAASTIVDPVEFIRTVDLARYYSAKFGGGPGASAKRAQAAEVLKGRGAAAAEAPGGGT